MLKNLIKKIPGNVRMAKLLGLIPQQPDERKFLLEMLPRQSVGAEIGVHMGDFSQNIIEAISPRELHLIDPWEYQASSVYETAWYGGGAKGGQTEMDERYSSILSRFNKNIHAEQVTVHRGYSTDILQQFPDQYFDWVYIDGNHLYEYVKKDLELSFQKVKPGGYITGDDYTEGHWWKGGVKKAVDECAANQSVQLVEIRNGQFIFRKSNESVPLNNMTTSS
ncbi:MAG: class I SAM-dependent methyltransferase [Leptolyngbya sp. RL_3_1]|nr:class I SAM-dependent methyltransferase [Leptolyngbya sp. RL_3_1]